MVVAGPSSHGGEKASTSGKGDDNGVSYVNVGLEKPVKVFKSLDLNERVTVRLKDKGFPQQQEGQEDQSDFFRGKVVSSLEPRQRKGTFWGYSVRLASSLSEALEGGPTRRTGGTT